MAERVCDYCKFEIPWEASVCGHCGKDNNYRTELKKCKKHEKSYDAKVWVSDGTTSDKCPLCTKELSEKFQGEAEPLISEIEQLKKSTDDLQIKRKKINLSLLDNNRVLLLDKNGVIREPSQLVFDRAGPYALVAAIVSGILYAVWEIPFITSFIIFYAILIIRFIFFRYRPYKTLTEEIEYIEGTLNDLQRRLERLEAAKTRQWKIL